MSHQEEGAESSSEDDGLTLSLPRRRPDPDIFEPFPLHMSESELFAFQLAQRLRILDLSFKPLHKRLNQEWKRAEWNEFPSRVFDVLRLADLIDEEYYTKLLDYQILETMSELQTWLNKPQCQSLQHVFFKTKMKKLWLVILRIRFSGVLKFDPKETVGNLVHGECILHESSHLSILRNAYQVYPHLILIPHEDEPDRSQYFDGDLKDCIFDCVSGVLDEPRSNAYIRSIALRWVYRNVRRNMTDHKLHRIIRSLPSRASNSPLATLRITTEMRLRSRFIWESWLMHFPQHFTELSNRYRSILLLLITPQRQRSIRNSAARYWLPLDIIRLIWSWHLAF